MSVRVLPTKSVQKVWGRTQLPAPFEADAGQRIGEIWFEPPAELDDLLVKFLFTSEKLSVQCHPSDEQAVEDEQGKEECWLVIGAEPGAKIAIGLKAPTDSEVLKSAANDGSIEGMLEWHTVKAGDFFYLPAGTIHAIGGGLSIVEIQQNSDTTFRLFDYGRPRELHLERGMEVAIRDVYPEDQHQKVGDDSQCLVRGPHFRLDRIVGEITADIAAQYEGKLLVLPLSGSVGSDDVSLDAGSCALADNVRELNFSQSEITLLMQPS